MSLANEERGLAGEDLPWPILRAVVLLRDEFTCAICGAYATQADHIFPQCYGGSDHPLNLQALCRPCNQRKGRSIFGHDCSWNAAYMHLTWEQLSHYIEECEAHHRRLTMEYDFYRERIDDMHAGVVEPGDPIDMERHGFCPSCSVDGDHFTKHDGPCGREAS